MGPVLAAKILGQTDDVAGDFASAVAALVAEVGGQLVKTIGTP